MNYAQNMNLVQSDRGRTEPGFVKTFQLSLDTDTCMIGPSPDGKHNRKA